MSTLINLKQENSTITGYLSGIEINNKNTLIAVEFPDEQTLHGVNDFIEKHQYIFENISTNSLKDLIRKLAKELTDSAYSQSDYIPNEEDYLHLQNELELQKIDIYAEDCVLLSFQAENEYPDMEICCQVDYSMIIEDISVQ